MKKARLLMLVLALGACGDEASHAAPAAPPVAVTAPAAPARPEPAELTVAAVNTVAPDFTLTDQAGARHQLSSYRGRIVVLEWTNPTCPFVVRHTRAGTMRTLDGAYPDTDVVWLAIDSTRTVVPAESAAFREANSLAYPVLQDPHGVVGRQYGARTTPHMFVIDREGKIRYSGAIDDDPRGQNATPVNHVDRAVRALLTGQAPPVSSTEPYGCSVKYEGA
jgi:peroxiredoxin